MALPEGIIRLSVSEDVAGDDLFSHYTSPFVAALGSVSSTLLTNIHTPNLTNITQCFIGLFRQICMSCFLIENLMEQTVVVILNFSHNNLF